MPNKVNLAIFWKPEFCSQTVLPDRSILLGQKLVENAKSEKLKFDILGDFQTLWMGANCSDFFLEHMQYWCVACLRVKSSFLEQSSELPGEFNSSAAKLRRVSQQLILALKILNIIPKKVKIVEFFLSVVQ